MHTVIISPWAKHLWQSAATFMLCFHIDCRITIVFPSTSCITSSNKCNNNISALFQMKVWTAQHQSDHQRRSGGSTVTCGSCGQNLRLKRMTRDQQQQLTNNRSHHHLYLVHFSIPCQVNLIDQVKVTSSDSVIQVSILFLFLHDDLRLTSCLECDACSESFFSLSW